MGWRFSLFRQGTSLSVAIPAFEFKIQGSRLGLRKLTDLSNNPNFEL
jgi:hypothetical protein